MFEVKQLGTRLHIRIKISSAPVKFMAAGHINLETATLNYIPSYITIENEAFIGLDYEVLHSMVCTYAYITFEYASNKYETTRLFMKRNGIETLEDGRHIVMLQVRKFGLYNAVMSDRVAEGKQISFLANKTGSEVIIDGKVHKG